MGVRQESAMAVLSSLITTAANLAPRRLLHSTKARAGGYSVQQRPSRWEWDRLKDDIHFYLMLTGIPTLALITYMNLVHGNSELRAIPEGCVPREEEYFANPISRFIVKHFKVGFQELYEVSLHNLWQEKKEMDVRRQMQIHGDYKAWYHRADVAHYTRQSRKIAEEQTETRGHRLQDD